MLRTDSPDMIAFTIGQVVLHLAREGKNISAGAISLSLSEVVDGGPLGRVSPDAARSALEAIARPVLPDEFTPQTRGRGATGRPGAEWRAA